MTTPTVSVVVTCFNLGRYLEEALDSVLAQTFTDFEIVVVDDGSTDAATISAIDGLVRPRTRVIRLENRGLPGARNEGIRQTTGRLICCLDADDRLAPTWLEKGVAFLEAHPEVTFVSHWLRTFGDESADWTPERCDLETLLTVNTVNGAALVRRDAIAMVGGYDESMVDGCEDWDLWLTLVERGHVGAIIPEVLFFYRRHSNSMSRQMSLGDRPHRLFETLIRKHADSYRRHVTSIVAALERELAKGRYEVEKHRAEQATVLAPEVTRSQRRLEALRAKATRFDSAQHQCQLAALQQSLKQETARREAAEREAARLRQEVTDVRQSWTWRLTQPVRTVIDFLRSPLSR